MEIVDRNRHVTIRTIAEKLQLSTETVHRHLKPKNLTIKLDSLVITYDNIKRKRSWSKHGESSQTVAKSGLTAQKVLLSVWWDIRRIIHYEVLPYGQTINSDLYCEQLERLKIALEQKRSAMVNRKGVVFHHDNARPHMYIFGTQNLRELLLDRCRRQHYQTTSIFYIYYFI
ncbi:histone-lysine N-methyltransferase SETMAR-like [Drosophila ananassae]|uniref:histone-lysine N-methyltransferase SETMAR-like n=1 Tax=Drosophila ananassae TaxID=7217 RepID=UPI001CFFB18B|nr:histone-lysine N-methyltransferase SETMAR-like [Drosophila ananassae]